MTEPLTSKEQHVEQTLWRCWFDDPSGNRRSFDTPDGIVALREGFHVDNDWQYGKAWNCRHWVPPSRIVLITRLERSDDQ